MPEKSLTDPTEVNVLLTNALEKIKSKAYGLALFNPDQETAVAAWDIFWLSVAALEGREKASALTVFSALSGIATDNPERIIKACGSEES